MSRDDEVRPGRAGEEAPRHRRRARPARARARARLARALEPLRAAGRAHGRCRVRERPRRLPGPLLPPPAERARAAADLRKRGGRRAARLARRVARGVRDERPHRSGGAGERGDERAHARRRLEGHAAGLASRRPPAGGRGPKARRRARQPAPRRARSRRQRGAPPADAGAWRRRPEPRREPGRRLGRLRPRGPPDARGSRRRPAHAPHRRLQARPLAALPGTGTARLRVERGQEARDRRDRPRSRERARRSPKAESSIGRSRRRPTAASWP